MRQIYICTGSSVNHRNWVIMPLTSSDFLSKWLIFSHSELYFCLFNCTCYWKKKNVTKIICNTSLEEGNVSLPSLKGNSFVMTFKQFNLSTCNTLKTFSKHFWSSRMCKKVDFISLVLCCNFRDFRAEQKVHY